MSTNSSSIAPGSGYLGLYVSSDLSIKLVLTRERCRLSLAIYGVPGVRFEVEPTQVSSTGWPSGLYELAHCRATSPRPATVDKKYSEFNVIRFACKSGVITTLRWKIYETLPGIVFTKLPQTASNLLRIPAEIRRMITQYAVNESKVLAAKQHKTVKLIALEYVTLRSFYQVLQDWHSHGI
ncbi:hypothetical protein T440DRAFT_520484 [Plenodomus tracheiphilus IPT5]|uniref:Uncharacterized protein n=1 Tax=Plenodomus tracheiphilus IPT5 TaxID=1408161 RepID=A0A6A7AYB9_9PLEO|nr:hypothetical protein T440DRAFT_520484 [Plenodomus tracheiphilus IPT5]